MLRLTWTCTVLCLIGGVFLLASAIFTGSSKVERELASQRNQMAEKMLKLNEEAVKKGADVGRVLKKIATSANAENEAAEGNADPGGEAGRSVSEATAVKSRGADARVALDPVDEEDRQLTAAVMNHGKAKKQDTPEKVEEPAGKALYESTAEAIGKKDVAQKPTPPPDFERLNRIKDLYVKTMQILDFK